MGYLREIWCRAMHESLMWPAHGRYECCTCGREYPVPWERDLTNALWSAKNSPRWEVGCARRTDESTIVI